MMSILREKIHDNRFLILVENLLKAGYLEQWNYRPTLSGTPQGGIVSPLLANIYLDRLDKYVEQTLIPRVHRGQGQKTTAGIQPTVVHGSGNSSRKGCLKRSSSLSTRSSEPSRQRTTSSIPNYRRLRVYPLCR